MHNENDGAGRAREGGDVDKRTVEEDDGSRNHRASTTDPLAVSTAESLGGVSASAPLPRAAGIVAQSLLMDDGDTSSHGSLSSNDGGT